MFQDSHCSKTSSLTCYVLKGSGEQRTLGTLDPLKIIPESCQLSMFPLKLIFNLYLFVVHERCIASEKVFWRVIFIYFTSAVTGINSTDSIPVSDAITSTIVQVKVSEWKEFCDICDITKSLDVFTMDFFLLSICHFTPFSLQWLMLCRGSEPFTTQT